MTAFAISISILLLNGGTIGANSLPETWPTEEACQQEAKAQQAHIEKEWEGRAAQVRVQCFPVVRLSR